MSLFAEFHVIQNFAPSNLNRDDTGAPKDAMFGGYRRARVSSQCFKRAVRTSAGSMAALLPEERGVRTKKLRALLLKRLAERGHPEAQTQVATALEAAGLKLDDDGKTEYLLFLGNREIDAFADLVHSHWEALTPTDAAAGPDKGKRSKKEAKAAAPDDVVKAARRLLDGGKAIDLALFGRMLTDLPEANRHAACQVAHAISTHRVEREFDYFTAIDDLAEEGEPSAAMLASVEFNSATFYRYAVLDVAKLVENLGGDSELALRGLQAFSQAFVRAVPTGKQNTFAAHNAPSFVGVVLRHASPFNLANAFEKPVQPARDRALTEASVAQLGKYEQRMARMYGDARDAWAVLDDTGQWPAGVGEPQQNLEALVAWLHARIQSHLQAGS